MRCHTTPPPPLHHQQHTQMKRPWCAALPDQEHLCRGAKGVVNNQQIEHAAARPSAARSGCVPEHCCHEKRVKLTSCCCLLLLLKLITTTTQVLCRRPAGDTSRRCAWKWFGPQTSADRHMPVHVTACLVCHMPLHMHICGTQDVPNVQSWCS